MTEQQTVWKLDAWIDEFEQHVVFRLRHIDRGLPDVKAAVSLKQLPRLVAIEIIRRLTPTVEERQRQEDERAHAPH